MESQSKTEETVEDSARNLYYGKERVVIPLNVPKFVLPGNLKLELPQGTIDRCSFFATISCINRALKSFHINEASRHYRNMSPKFEIVGNEGCNDELELSIIDEENLLLDIIQTSSTIRKEIYINGFRHQEHFSSLSTHLWKPKRSWWEFKSRKNAWVEPNCHNKRWW